MSDGAQFLRADQRGEPVLVVSGEIDLSTSGRFDDHLAELIRAAHSPAIVDLSAVTFFDSSGINGLVRANESADAAGVDLILRAPSHQVVTVLQLTGLSDHFTMRAE